MPRSMVLPALLFVGATACGGWKRARQVVMSAAEGVAQADREIERSYQESSCPDEQDPILLERCVARLETQVEVLQEARSVVETGEGVVDLWHQGGTEPTSWRGWLQSAARTSARLVELLESFGAPVPVSLVSFAAQIDALLEGGQ